MARRRARNKPVRHGRKERIRAELRQFVLGFSMVLGLVLAMPWALAYEAKLAPCERDSGACLERFYDQFVPVLGRMGLGIGLGLAFGLALCLLTPGLKRNRQRRATPR